MHSIVDPLDPEPALELPDLLLGLLVLRPRVEEALLHAQPLLGVEPQDPRDEGDDVPRLVPPHLRGEQLGQDLLPVVPLGEKPAGEHGVETDAEAPHIEVAIVVEVGRDLTRVKD